MKITAQGFLGSSCGWNLRDWMWAEDSNGNQYTAQGWKPPEGQPRVMAVRRGTGWNRVTYEYVLMDFDPAAEWVELLWEMPGGAAPEPLAFVKKVKEKMKKVLDAGCIL